MPWKGRRPFRFFVLASLAVVAAILTVKILSGADTRLQVYVVEVGVIFLLGFVILKGERLRDLDSRTTWFDVGLATSSAAALFALNLGLGSAGGLRASPQPGFADAIILVLILFVAAYGVRSVRAMAAPLSLLVILAGITHFISDDDPTFYAYVGRYFVSFTVWMSSAILQLAGYAVSTGPDFFRILGDGTLTVELGIRCGGLDVATIYTLLIGYFAWQSGLRPMSRMLVVVGAAVGTLIVNGLRVALLTVLFLNYPVDLVEAVHTNLGDFIFLGYALAFILVLRRYPPRADAGGSDPPAPPR